MIHEGYCAIWWEKYHDVEDAAAKGALLMNDDLAELIQISERITGTAELLRIDSTPIVEFLKAAEASYYSSGGTLPAVTGDLGIWLVRVRLALTERRKAEPSSDASKSDVASVEDCAAPYGVLPFEFDDINKDPVVRGKKKKKLTDGQHDVLSALKAAGPGGLTKDELDKKSQRRDARTYLRELLKDPEWASVIVMPVTRGQGGYRLRFS